VCAGRQDHQITLEANHGAHARGISLELLWDPGAYSPVKRGVTLNAARFAALLLILAGAFTTVLPRPKGLPAWIARVVPCGLDDGRIVVIQILTTCLAKAHLC
jgi:hypothetical protein